MTTIDHVLGRETEAGWDTASLAAALDKQHKAVRGAPPASAAIRKDRLDRLAAALASNADALVTAITEDFGTRPRTATLAAEITVSLTDIAALRRHLGRWMKPRHPQPAYIRLAGIRTWVEPHPLGAVGVIAPWNFPIVLAVQPAAAALAAGNRVMIKMSELTPRTAVAFERAIAGYFAPEELLVVRGGADVGAAFSGLPFDHLFFTGSPEVGRSVQSAAAANLTPVTLELGGKNPAVVDQAADVKQAAKRIVSARLANSGQLCLSPDYVFVPEHLQQAFLAAAEAACREAVPAMVGNDDYCAIINDRHYDRVTGLVENAAALGANVVEMIPPGEQFPSPGTRKVPFTLLTGVTEDMKVMQEEIFGPLLPVISYRSVDEVIEYVNARPAPLAAYWFGPGSADFRSFADRTRSGGVSRNDFALHAAIDGLPFGGVGNSGSGYYHGQFGFDTFSHLRSFAESPKLFSPVAILSPPFSPRLEQGLRWFVHRHAAAKSKRIRQSARSDRSSKGTSSS
jgi:coniferyl-aldehyde dehydrogenase